jgi:hypothetical protein
VEIAEKIKNTFWGVKRIIYSKTNFKDLYTKSTNNSQDKCIRFYIRRIFSSEISKWMAPSNIL